MAPPAAAAPQSKRSILPWIVAAVLALAIAVLAVLWPRHPDIASFDPMPLTWYPGLETDPALSPDGNLVAFTWSGAGFDQQQVYVKHLDASQPLRITHDDKASYASPAWSPDGRRLAVVKANEKGPALVLIPALGGPEREVGRFNGWGSSCWLEMRNSVVVTDCSSGHAAWPPSPWRAASWNR